MFPALPNPYDLKRVSKLTQDLDPLRHEAVQVFYDPTDGRLYTLHLSVGGLAYHFELNHNGNLNHVMTLLAPVSEDELMDEFLDLFESVFGDEDEDESTGLQVFDLDDWFQHIHMRGQDGTEKEG